MSIVNLRAPFVPGKLIESKTRIFSMAFALALTTQWSGDTTPLHCRQSVPYSFSNDEYVNFSVLAFSVTILTTSSPTPSGTRIWISREILAHKPH